MRPITGLHAQPRPRSTPLRTDRRARSLVIGLAARAEQEIRAYPRLHSAFYTAVTRNPVVRDLLGRVKDQVRGAGPEQELMALAAEEPEVEARRRAAVARRLGVDRGAP